MIKPGDERIKKNMQKVRELKAQYPDRKWDYNMDNEQKEKFKHLKNK